MEREQSSWGQQFDQPQKEPKVSADISAVQIVAITILALVTAGIIIFLVQLFRNWS